MADRYTVLKRSPDDLRDTIMYAAALGLEWFVTKDPNAYSDILIYLFFDDAGLRNYLDQTWGNNLDKVSDWVAEVKNQEIDDVVFVQRCIELFLETGGD